MIDITGSWHLLIEWDADTSPDAQDDEIDAYFIDLQQAAEVAKKHRGYARLTIEWCPFSDPGRF